MTPTHQALYRSTQYESNPVRLGGNTCRKVCSLPTNCTSPSARHAVTQIAATRQRFAAVATYRVRRTSSQSDGRFDGMSGAAKAGLRRPSGRSKASRAGPVPCRRSRRFRVARGCGLSKGLPDQLAASAHRSRTRLLRIDRAEMRMREILDCPSHFGKLSSLTAPAPFLATRILLPQWRRWRRGCSTSGPFDCAQDKQARTANSGGLSASSGQASRRTP